MKEDYVECIIKNPAMLKEYFNIDFFIEKDCKIDFLNKKNYRILFWNFLLGKLDGRIELYIYKSKLYWWNNEETLNVCENINFSNSDLDRFYLIQPFILKVYEKAKIFQSNINKVIEFEKNEELMRIWFSLSRQYTDYEKKFIEIAEKINFLYEELYKDTSNLKFSKNDICYILSHHRFVEKKERDLIIKNLEKKKMDTIESKNQFVEFCSKEFEHYCVGKNFKYKITIIEWFAVVLGLQKDMCIQIKIDIVENIDNIVNQICNQICNQIKAREREIEEKSIKAEEEKERKERIKRIKMAQQERDELLNNCIYITKKCKCNKKNWVKISTQNTSGKVGSSYLIRCQKCQAQWYSKAKYVEELPNG